jgi:cobalamin biosynthesis protein CobD/CbiB
MRSLGTPDERRTRPVGRAAALIEKIDNFLPSRLGPGIVFQKGRQAGLALPVRGARDQGFGVMSRR